MESPLVQKGSGISPIWVLPLVALCISGWLLYTSIRDAGIPITIHFENAEGITAGKTHVMYKGVPVGLVEEITVDEDLQGVSLQVTMEKKARRGLVKDTKFWIVRPQISEGRISGLETILSGSYIAVQPGSSTIPSKRFEGLEETPPLPADSPGLHLTLMSDALYSLQKDSPVYSKNLKIGKVLRYYLDEDKSVLIDLYIEPEYSHLIQMDTRFWNSSGIAFEGNLQSGFSLKLESMEALIYGGISCGTPEPLADTSPQAMNGLVYKLYRNYEAAEYGIPMALDLVTGEGIVEGKTRVMFRGLEAGVVKTIRINNDEHFTVTAEILLDPRAEPILRNGTRFWVMRPEVSLDGISRIDSLVSGPYITFLPGGGVYRDHFVVEKKPMPRQISRDGKRFTLISEKSILLEAGSPVLFKQMPVGEVVEITLGKGEQKVYASILVYEEHAHLVRENSVFWERSGIRLDAGIKGIRLDMGTIKSMLKGGVSFTNPKNGTEPLKAAGEGTSFALHPNLGEAVKAIPGLHPSGMVLHLSATADRYYEAGAPVLYGSTPAGEVIGSRLSDDARNTVVDILIFEKFAGLVNRASLFFDNSGFRLRAGMNGIEVQAGNFASILTGGISFVTAEEAETVETGRTFPLFASYDAALHKDNITITLRMNKSEGVRQDTKVRYQGIEIGSVREVRFGSDLQEVIATASIEKKAATLFRETSVLWLAKPKIDLKGVHNVATLLTGPYITVIKGKGALKTDFSLQEGEPRIESGSGLNIVLETPRRGFLDVGNPVYYRQIQVGHVTGYDLAPTAQKVLIRVTVYPEYAKLVYSNSRFWLSSGVRASWDLFSGLKLDAESLESLLSGGIAFATPEGDNMGEPVEDNAIFQLHEKKEPQWTSWAPILEKTTPESQVDNVED